MATACDLVRAGAAAVNSGQCGLDVSPAACRVTDRATKTDIYYQTKYDPTGFLTQERRTIRERALDVLDTDITTDGAILGEAYSKPPAVTWATFGTCLWNENGQPGGVNNNTYFERDDLAALGYRPRPALGGSFMEGKLPTAITSRVPLWADRVANPDLFAFVVLLIYAVVFARLLAWARKKSRGGALHPDDELYPHLQMRTTTSRDPIRI